MEFFSAPLTPSNFLFPFGQLLDPPAIPENHDPQHLAHTSVIPRPQRELWGGGKTMHYHLLLSFEHESGLKRHFVLNWAHSKANKFFLAL